MESLSRPGPADDAAGPPPLAQRSYPCDTCGSRLIFAVGTSSLRCSHCGHQQEIPHEEGAAVLEHSFAAWHAASASRPAGHVGAFEIRCTGCGAHTQTDRLSDHCPFCASPIVVEPDTEVMITPEAVLPFDVPHEQALECLRAWIASRWFAPTALRSLAAHQGIDGTYLPSWTFDSRSTTRYRGRRGEHYWDTEWFTDSEGRQQSRQVQRTNWYPVTGTVQNVFDDVLVNAVRSLPADRIEKLTPWDLDAVTPYRPEYLAGFQTLRYEVQPPEGLELFKRSVQRSIEQTCRRDIGGDEQRLRSTDTDWGHVTFKLLLLPAWVAAYRYHDRVWRVMINARTGEVVGERPYSAWKITGAVLAVLILLALGVGAYQLTHP